MARNSRRYSAQEASTRCNWLPGWACKPLFCNDQTPDSVGRPRNFVCQVVDKRTYRFYIGPFVNSNGPTF